MIRRLDASRPRHATANNPRVVIWWQDRRPGASVYPASVEDPGTPPLSPAGRLLSWCSEGPLLPVNGTRRGGADSHPDET